jgi:hypothetical protein
MIGILTIHFKPYPKEKRISLVSHFFFSFCSLLCVSVYMLSNRLFCQLAKLNFGLQKIWPPTLNHVLCRRLHRHVWKHASQQSGHYRWVRDRKFQTGSLSMAQGPKRHIERKALSWFVHCRKSWKNIYAPSDISELFHEDITTKISEKYSP